MYIFLDVHILTLLQNRIFNLSLVLKYYTRNDYKVIFTQAYTVCLSSQEIFLTLSEVVL